MLSIENLPLDRFLESAKLQIITRKTKHLFSGLQINEYFRAKIYFMAGNRTFTMVKPDAFAAGNSGAIIKMIEEAGFRIKAIKLTQLTPEKAGEFYAVHKERPFYNDLRNYMSSGPIIAIILEKENAIADFRKLIGATNPAQAEQGTIRKLFAKSIEANAVHGSDSDENAQIEGNFFFSGLERI
jgi:nucleoside-diphosphate kinase